MNYNSVHQMHEPAKLMSDLNWDEGKDKKGRERQTGYKNAFWVKKKSSKDPLVHSLWRCRITPLALNELVS